MSEKAEKVQAAVETIYRGDFDDAMRYLHPEIEIHPAWGGVMDVEHSYRGHTEVMEMLATLSETPEGWRGGVDAEEVLDAGDDRLVRVERWRSHGREGIETEEELTHIYTFRDGLIVRIDGFRDRNEALEAAGLSE